MARLPRLAIAGLPHLIIHRGLNQRPVFSDDVDRAAYLYALGSALAETRTALHGYGLFQSEVRLLVTPSEAAALAAMMQSIGRRYVRVFNQRHQHSGTPWEGRFRSCVVEPSERVLACLRYAEDSGAGGTSLALAPERALASSAAHHAGVIVDPLITEHGSYWALGNTPFEREAAYRRYVEELVTEDEQSEVRAAALKGWAYGSPEFTHELSEQTGRRSHPLKRGRPRKAASQQMPPG